MKKLKSFIGLSLAAALPITASLMCTNHVNFNNNQNLKTFNGHFPGMGPYGPDGNQDHAFGTEHSINNGKLKGVEFYEIDFDISTTSINWINTHYTGPGTKGDTVWYGIYDFLTDAYPSGDFTSTFYDLKVDGNVPSINTIMKALSDWIGLNGKGLNELADKPAFFHIYANPWGDFDWTWAAGPNNPFTT